jgi:ketosteroid isomerase-like protein
MSQENLELAQAALAAFIEVDEGLADPERLEEFFAQDVITTFSGFMEMERTLRGADEFLKWRATWMEPYDDWSYQVEKILDAGSNQVVVTLRQRGKPRGSGSWVEMHYGLVYTVEEGLIRRVEFHETPRKALEAAGLRE